MERISIIIPAYKPDEKLITTLNELQNAGIKDILLINDGSGEEFTQIFQRAEKIDTVTLIEHKINRGKGAALKTAMKYFLENRKDYIGVVTADADGQHRTEDILAVAKKMKETEEIVLGCRDFSDKNVPARSKFGNRVTIGTFRLFFGMKISDTQTGLRAFPMNVIESLLTVTGDRYEYETQMLFHINRNRLPFKEVKIQTVYIEENASSHFRPLVDSLKIYSLILKYFLSSSVSTVVDIVAFFLLKKFPLFAIPYIPQTFPAAFMARVISSFVNYTINSKAVFKEKLSKKTLIRYYTLLIMQIMVSSVAVYSIEHILHIKTAIFSTAIKLMVDTILFFFSFRIQHKWVFNIEK